VVLRPRGDEKIGIGMRRWRLQAVCWHTMKRTTVKLPDDLDARVRQEAQRRGVTISELTRTAIEAQLGSGPRRRLDAAAAGRSGRTDISERVEEIIAAEGARSR
jgi:predicted transcriptional regulator